MLFLLFDQVKIWLLQIDITLTRRLALLLTGGDELL